MKDLRAGGRWPTPDEWRSILGESLANSLEADAAEIIKSGRSNDTQEELPTRRIGTE